MFLYGKPNSNHRKGSGARCRLNSYVKYPAGSSYHLTRLVFMKTSSPALSFATGGTFPNCRASVQFTATLATMILTKDARKGYPHSNGLGRFTAPGYVGPYDTPILVRMSRSEVPMACYQAKARHVFLCIYRLSSTVDGCGSNVASALSDNKYTRVPLTHARPFITCHVNNTVLCILLSRSNDEWTCTYARGIGTISIHNSTDRTHGRKQVVKSSKPNVDA